MESFEEKVARLTDEEAEYAMSLRGDLFWAFLAEREAA